MTKYSPGKSGNPSGKPKGAKSRFTVMRDQLLDDLPELLRVTKQQALTGDTTALRLLLERTLPAQKATAAPVDIPSLKTAPTLTQKAQAIIDAIGDGIVPPDVGASLLAALGNVSKIIETDELEQRIAALEKLNGKH